ncbi:hypothetical protein [Paenibacillus sp. GYB003]|uniref:hypothetical protein n=1 Tax=Paenibacillus sp. GYB003 TaxID=2994392 RepID=UPI002F96A13A
MKRNKAEAYWTVPYLTIWGTQWMADSLLQYIWMADPHGAVRKTLLGVAAALTVLLVVRDRVGRSAASSRQVAAVGIPALAAAALLLVVALSARLGTTALFVPELLRCFLLAAFYVWIGVRLGRELVYLGLWLAALGIVIWSFYLGYAPIILGFSGGASLLACALIFRFWRG